MEGFMWLEAMWWDKKKIRRKDLLFSKKIDFSTDIGTLTYVTQTLTSIWRSLRK
ncbi:hypothetical protein HKBW3C_01706 [Candidatus Hakubella thermalkaliphila]|nr:hypothetical protein HKBW3C_01706 [Candidatus Hakubella thermalkaliphila]